MPSAYPTGMAAQSPLLPCSEQAASLATAGSRNEGAIDILSASAGDKPKALPRWRSVRGRVAAGTTKNHCNPLDIALQLG